MNERSITEPETEEIPAGLERVGESKLVRAFAKELARTAEEKSPPLEDIRRGVEKILKIPGNPEHPPNWRDPKTGLKERHLRKAGIHVALFGWAEVANRQIDSDSQKRVEEVIEEMREDIKNTKEFKPVSDRQVQRAVNLGNLVINLIDGENEEVEQLLAKLKADFVEEAAT